MATTTETATDMDDENPKAFRPRHRRNTSTATNGFYSGRNQVPRIESLWELYPGRESTPDEELERSRRVRENSKVVVDPITGGE